MGEDEEVSGEGDGAAEGEEIPETDAAEEIFQSWFRRSGKEERPEKARSSSDRGGPAWAGRALGERRAGMMVRSGTKTTTRPVMKADFAAVVRARPAVWNW